ncbi:Starch-binding associating with outer membrane [Aquiflexum balticum DSM 16537]|uniref:Starch-binding associating with outer membrane n=1 Tax=Aquiflexum balticum DSM 16537 TaxID=758820 RepID=A0A1W2HBN0_9BACT|nr:SusD/RagB family nutrient-binding outer membrane lipoprotein [Aquiflexum balticum]SMD46138.1 Starch-binding associating with outer membrane [Aquiflexum balticum DSM 16537]
MKNLSKLNIFLIALVMVFLASCDNWLDVNENPNNPTDAPIQGLLTNVVLESTLNVQRAGSITSNYVQHLASPNPSSSSDIMEPLDFSGTWGSFYGIMSDITDLINKSENLGASHYVAVGQTMMAMNLGLVVDMWGNAPYSEGFTFETVTPKFDDDQQLYAEINALLDQALVNFNQASSVTVRGDDFIFQGNIPRWIKFVNSLKARYMIHMKGKPGYNAGEVLAAVSSGFVGNIDDAKMNFFEQRRNPWEVIALNNQNLLLGGWISSQFIEALDGTSYPIEDPRLPLMVGATDNGEYIGVENGAGRGDAPERGARSVLIPGQFYTTRTGPVLIMTFSELKFIEAEAAFETDKVRAYAAYLEGIRAHMRMLSVNDASLEAYISHPSVSMGVAAFTINDIFKEKWIATFLNPETWNDARRFDYAYKDMTIPESLNPNLNGQFIRRLAYPDSEVSRNGNNVPSVTLLDRIWWNE